MNRVMRSCTAGTPRHHPPNFFRDKSELSIPPTGVLPSEKNRIFRTGGSAEPHSLVMQVLSEQLFGLSLHRNAIQAVLRGFAIRGQMIRQTAANAIRCILDETGGRYPPTVPLQEFTASLLIFLAEQLPEHVKRQSVNALPCYHVNVSILCNIGMYAAISAAAS